MANEPPDDKSLRDTREKFTNKSEADRVNDFLNKRPDLRAGQTYDHTSPQPDLPNNKKKSDDGSPARARTPDDQPTKSK